MAVLVTLIVSPSPKVGADGVPGLRSTKKLPSRKMRGRILAVASVWIGRPRLRISIFTTAASEPGSASTDLTLPMATPAMRTGEPGRMEFADSNCALSWNGVVKGMSFVKPRYVPDGDDQHRHETPAEVVGLAAHQEDPSSVLAGSAAAVLPICCCPATYFSLPASHSCGWPGDAV